MSELLLDAARKLREGTEVLRTTGGARLSASECSAVLDLMKHALDLDAWASRMPDAGFTSDSPRWAWWHERPRMR